jgi:quercetin dioxygenase-like cupin family protein
LSAFGVQRTSGRRMVPIVSAAFDPERSYAGLPLVLSYDAMAGGDPSNTAGLAEQQEVAMWRAIGLPVLTLMTALALGAVGNQPISAQQQPIKRTDLLKLDLVEIKDNEMHVWVADIAPSAATGRHSHPTPRFVYVLEGAVVLEMDGKPPETFKAGQAFAEPPNAIHNFRNASTTEPAKALGFQYAGKGQALQINAP